MHFTKGIFGGTRLRAKITMSKNLDDLKKILYKYLPKNLVDRKKTGFRPPIDNKAWILKSFQLWQKRWL